MILQDCFGSPFSEVDFMPFKVRELMKGKRTVLASASPRRKELMKLLSDDFEIIPSDCDESIPDGAVAFRIAELLAERKCREVAARCMPDSDTVVIGCDTLVLDGALTPMGKPKDDSDALRMLTALQDSVSYVTGGVCVYFRGEFHTFTEKTEVTFYPASEEVLRAYIATGEPGDKAGAYAVQGLGGLLIKRICGDYNNVVGLPAARLARELAEIFGG
jgi:septum formation protein